MFWICLWPMLLFMVVLLFDDSPRIVKKKYHGVKRVPVDRSHESKSSSQLREAQGLYPSRVQTCRAIYRTDSFLPSSRCFVTSRGTEYPSSSNHRIHNS